MLCGKSVQHRRKNMYKNWSEVVKLGKISNFLMMGIAQLEVNDPTPEVLMVMSKFPECFDAEEEIGPVPLSCILEKTRQEMQQEGNFEGVYHPGSYRCIPSHIPIQEFCYGDSDLHEYPDVLPLPGGVRTDIKIGETFDWMEERFVVLENNKNHKMNNIYAAPVECILVDVAL